MSPAERRERCNSQRGEGTWTVCARPWSTRYRDGGGGGGRGRGMHLPGRVLCLQQLSQEKKSAPAVCAWIHVTGSPAPGQGRQRQPEGSSLRVTVERPAGQEDKETESDQMKHESSILKTRTGGQNQVTHSGAAWRPLGSSEGLEITAEVERTGPSARRQPQVPPPAEPLPLSLTCLTIASSSARCCPAGVRKDQLPSISRSAMCFRFLMTTTKGAQKPPNSKFKSPVMTLQKSNKSLGLF